MTSSIPSLTAPDCKPEQCTISPVIDCEPVPEPLGRARGPVACPTPSVDALHRRPPHPIRAHRPPLNLSEPPPPKSAVVFAETALRQVIEVIDRRRPVAQLRPLMTPVLVDRVIAHAGAARRGSATMRRVRVRAVDTGADSGLGAGTVSAAEVFASFTRSGRVHAVAARIERYRDRWRMVALQIG
jgi:hypothetical protein